MREMTKGEERQGRGARRERIVEGEEREGGR